MGGELSQAGAGCCEGTAGAGMGWADTPAVWRHKGVRVNRVRSAPRSVVKRALEAIESTAFF